MQNLEQRRAASALTHASGCRKREGEGDCLSGYSALIINNGLLACLAFSINKEKQHLRVANAIATHLHRMEICLHANGERAADAQWLLKHLSSHQISDHTLRRATAEALAFLGYLKRFANSDLRSADATEPTV